MENFIINVKYLHGALIRVPIVPSLNFAHSIKLCAMRPNWTKKNGNFSNDLYDLC